MARRSSGKAVPVLFHAKARRREEEDARGRQAPFSVDGAARRGAGMESRFAENATFSRLCAFA